MKITGEKEVQQTSSRLDWSPDFVEDKWQGKKGGIWEVNMYLSGRPPMSSANSNTELGGEFPS